MGYYQRCGTINRTILVKMPWWAVDFQALPPRSWCCRCGGEVYGYAEECDRCRGNRQWTIDNGQC